jgi:tripartite-type tricarboxylate transporter receptor subunit TctC
VLGFGRAGGFSGLFAPAGTPAPLVKRISDEVRAILASPAIEPNLKALTVSAAYEDETAFAAFLATETARWKQTLQSLKLAK